MVMEFSGVLLQPKTARGVTDPPPFPCSSIRLGKHGTVHPDESRCAVMHSQLPSAIHSVVM